MEVGQEFNFVAQVVGLELVDVDDHGQVGDVAGAHGHERLVDLALLHLAVAQDDGVSAEKHARDGT